MARARGGTVGYVAAIFIFGVWAVIASVVAVVFFALDTKDSVARENAVKNRNEAVTSKDLDDPNLLELKKEGSGSYVSMLLDENKKLKTDLNANPRSSLKAIEADAEAAGLKGLAAITAYRTLSERYADKEDRIKKLDVELKKASSDVQAAEAAKAALAAKYNADLSAMAAQVADRDKQTKSFTDKMQGGFDSLNAQITKLNADHLAAMKEKDNQITELTTEVTRLRRALAEATRGQTRTDVVVDPSIQPDGTIIAVLGEDNIVYVNLGRKNHMVLGMTFEVFNPSTLIKKDQFHEIRGKATVEVVQVLETTSAARIVRLERGQVVTEGDGIANLVYDPNMTLRFYVFGDFDIDNTGTPSNTDHKRIETMITEWGGRLMDKLSYETDFLVLGPEPTLPEKPKENEFNSVVLKQYEVSLARYQTFQDLVSKAQSLRIPVLNQNRFLWLTGYYQRVPAQENVHKAPIYINPDAGGAPGAPKNPAPAPANKKMGPFG